LETKSDKTIQFIENFLNTDYNSLQSNLEILLKDYKRKTKRLDKIIKQSDNQQKEMIRLHEELDEYKNSLEIKVEQEIKKREEKEKMLLQQSKLAAMGEMIDAVAHQWKQPINIINMQVDILGYDYEDKLVNKTYIENFQHTIFEHIQHMTNTLNEFRTFFRPNKNVEEFNVKSMVEKVLLLTKDEFIKNMITINLNDTNNFTIIGVENEFKHLILNIINNAKDAFIDNNINNRVININLITNATSNIIEIIDNAGGIPENIINDIFKANVTTKDESKGTGIGLYMSSQIATKHNGTLKVYNVTNGAKFIFEQKTLDKI